MSEPKIVTEWIDLTVGETTMSAFLAYPEAPGDYPGVVVAHEIYGQHESVRAATERLAALGVVAILPDLFHRDESRATLEFTPEGRERGLALLRTLTREGVVADVAAALAELDRRATTSAHIVGFSAGGHAAYYAASRLPLSSITAFYPGWLTDTDIPLSTPVPTIESTPTIQARVLLFFGGQDPLIDPEVRATIENTLSANDIDHEIVVYEDAPHGFLFPGRDWYRKATAEDAWSRVAQVLRR
ncbi:dienelactone hydrolase family protein [Nocardia jejuensis]|uniref:dienelactone hydrolase family protein n=1 Tax=Nocardia jejuensis TaxID=328049 RepID=UPI0008333635|nr:dienelactone hydrolase family protein [Nocardia jejuensis]